MLQRASKMKHGKVFRICAGFIGALVTVVYLSNAAWLVPSQAKERQILAHRGLHQTYEKNGLERDDCTAVIIHTPVHRYQENTLPSIQKAIDLGANIVEIDIHPTIDGEFIVFHDWTLNCRTDGSGVTQDQTTDYLKSLDVGYGYTADNGKTYPFRGQFVGAMPTLGEVLTEFPATLLFVNIKGNNPNIAFKLTDYLDQNPFANRKRLTVYGGGASVIEKISALNPTVITMHKQQAKECLVQYLLLGWSGYVPAVCANSVIPVPINYTWVIWGWPNRFERRLQKVGSRAMLMGSYVAGQQAHSGVDNNERIPENFGGIVWTNRIDVIGPNH